MKLDGRNVRQFCGFSQAFRNRLPIDMVMGLSWKKPKS